MALGFLKKAGKFTARQTARAAKEVGERAVDNVTFGLLEKADKPIEDISEFFEDLREWQLAMGEFLENLVTKEDIAEFRRDLDAMDHKLNVLIDRSEKEDV